MTADKKQLQLFIRGEDPLQASAPLYSNFVAISRVGTDVQLEFIFVDINQLAILKDAMKTQPEESVPQSIIGKTVAKIVMPGLNFIQVQEHLNTIFKALHEEFQMQEVGNELRSGTK